MKKSTETRAVDRQWGGKSYLFIPVYNDVFPRYLGAPPEAVFLFVVEEGEKRGNKPGNSGGERGGSRQEDFSCSFLPSLSR